MLKGKDYTAADTDFLVVAAFLDRVMGCNDKPLLKAIHSLQSDIDKQLLQSN